MKGTYVIKCTSRENLAVYPEENSSSRKGEIASVSSCRPSMVSQVKHTCHTWCPQSHMLCSSPASQFHAIHECQLQQTLRTSCSAQHHHTTWNEKKWFLACLLFPVLFAIAGWNTHPILGQNLRCILWNISVEMGTLNVYKSFRNMSAFEGPWGQFTSCINVSCLEVGVCPSVTASHSPTTVHAFCPLSPCSLFAKVTFSTLVWGLGGWRDGEHNAALYALHSPWWLI